MNDLIESFKRFIIFSRIVLRVFSVTERKKKKSKEKFVFKAQKTTNKNHFTKRTQLKIKENSKLSQYDDDFHVYFKLISVFRSSIQWIMIDIISAVCKVIELNFTVFVMIQTWNDKNWIMKFKTLDMIAQIAKKKRYFQWTHRKQVDYVSNKIVSNFHYWQNEWRWLRFDNTNRKFIQSIFLIESTQLLRMFKKKMIIFARSSNSFRWSIKLNKISNFKQSFETRFKTMNFSIEKCEICQKTEHITIVCFEMHIIQFYDERNLEFLLKNRSNTKWIKIFTYIFSMCNSCWNLFVFVKCTTCFKLTT